MSHETIHSRKNLRHQWYNHKNLEEQYTKSQLKIGVKIQKQQCISERYNFNRTSLEQYISGDEIQICQLV